LAQKIEENCWEATIWCSFYETVKMKSNPLQIIFFVKVSIDK
jgi:hypothetical protein